MTQNKARGTVQAGGDSMKKLLIELGKTVLFAIAATLGIAITIRLLSLIG